MNLLEEIQKIFAYAECKIENNDIIIKQHNYDINNFDNSITQLSSLINENNILIFVGFKFFKNSILADLNKISHIEEIRFQNCTFGILKTANETINNKFVFVDKCKFYEEFEFNNCKFNKNIEFEETEFNNQEDIEKELIFKNCEFKEFIFKNSKFIGKFNFIDSCKFNKFTIENCYFHNNRKLKLGNIICGDFEFKIDNNRTIDTIEIIKSKFNFIKIYRNAIEKLNLKDCEINNLELDKDIKEKLEFNDTKFEKINFKNSIFQEEFHFESCTVKNKADFSNAKFMNNAYFNNTEFLGYADFHEAIFHNIASFYDVEFTKLMNFSSTIFKDFNKTNFVNVDIDKINISEIEKIIDEKYDKATTFKKEKKLLEDKVMTEKERDEELKFITLKSKIRWINNFRNSFRIIKHILLETNNSLDAQKFHKLELYAKEIELEYKIELENLNIRKLKTEKDEIKSEYKEKLKNQNMQSETEKIMSDFLDFKENLKNKKKLINQNKWKSFETFVDFNLLSIYRNTSEHHTNFVRILHFTITMISLYGLFILFLFNNMSESTLTFITSFSFIISFILLGFLIFKESSYKNSLYHQIATSIFLAPLLIFILKNIEFNDKATIIIGIFYILSLSLVLYAYTHKLFRTILTSISYPIFFVMLYTSTSSIIPFANFNSEFQNKYLEANISQANKSEILNLIRPINDKIESKNSNLNLEFKDKHLEVNITEANRSEIINLIISLDPEFNAIKNPNSSENLSISELNEYKKFIVENKEILKDSNATNEKFKQAIYADNSRDKTIKCISFIYAIILGLCLFSLQKTARRNSVVPS